MVKIRVVERSGVRDSLGEGLYWSRREGALFWTDILAPALNRLSLASGEVTRWAMPGSLGWVIERTQMTGFVAGFRNGIAELRLDPLEIVPVVDLEPDLATNRMNDAKADSQGRIWAGTMPITGDHPSGAFYRLDPDWTLTRVDGSYTIANGPAFSPDESWLYHTDSAKGVIYRFALRNGVLGRREIFVQFEPEWGTPDGMTCDSEGFLWVAQWGAAAVSRFSPSGKRVETIALPATQITNVCFAGDRLDRMFVTSAAEGANEAAAGCLFEIEAGFTGLPTRSFDG